MSDLSKASLKEILLQLECHFTWVLLKEDVDADEFEERILEQIEFLQSKSKVRNYNLLAYVKYLSGKGEEALENLQKAEEAVKIEYPGDIEKQSLVTWGNRAWVCYHLDRLTEAETYTKMVESVCKQHGSASPYKMKLPQIYCEKGWALLKFGGHYYEKAKESFGKALEEEPENPEFNAGYAITVYRMENNLKEKSAAKVSSFEPLKHAIMLNPDNAFVLPLLALQLQKLNRAREGKMHIEKALAKYPDNPYVLRYAGQFYRRNHNLRTSLLYLKKTLELTPNSSFLHHQVGLCYRAQYFEMKKARGKYQTREKMEQLMELCIFHFKEVVERKTKFFYAYLDLANMYAEGGQLQEAEETFQTVFAISKLTGAEKQQLHSRYMSFQKLHKKTETEALTQCLEKLNLQSEKFDGNKCK